VLSHEDGSFKIVNLSANLNKNDKEELTGKDYEILKQVYDPMLVQPAGSCLHPFKSADEFAEWSKEEFDKITVRNVD